MHLSTPATLLLLATTLTAQSPTWTQTSPAAAPGIRRDGAMAWDQPNNRLLLYGGVTQTPSTILAETWGYNGTTWTLLNPATAGAPRWGHRLVRNPATNRLLTFGGRSPTLSGFANDTAEWTGSTWSTIPTPTAPSARYGYAMAFDSVRQVAVLFGGRTASASKNDTWEFDGVAWTERFPAHSPSPRQDAAMHFDASLNRTILFGGRQLELDLVLGGTWSYDGDDWTQLAPANTPSPRYAMGTVFDSTRHRVVLYGGFDGEQLLQETYEFTGSDWRAITTANLPTNTAEAYSGYDPARKKFVLFGGFGGSFLNTTWEFNGGGTGSFATYGEACSPSEPTLVPALTGGVPTVNQPFTLDLTSIPNGSDVAAWGFGTSNQTWQGLPLPLDLSILGITGCELLAAPDVLELSLVAANSASFTLNIPNTPTLANATLYVQGILLSFAGPNLFVATSQGGRIVIGL
ncbi:MAG: hypothetical protein JNN13_14850 [Planctomycetes bacterium]|nr:hypothetical protein [Planctomycetota bacterium]